MSNLHIKGGLSQRAELIEKCMKTCFNIQQDSLSTAKVKHREMCDLNA